jgi:DNA replication protein DnaC
MQSRDAETKTKSRAGESLRSPAHDPLVHGGAYTNEGCSDLDCCIITLPRGSSSYVLCKSCNPRLTCTLCGGSGYKMRINPVTLMEEADPNGCTCMRRERGVAHLNDAGIPARYLDASLILPPLIAADSPAALSYRSVLTGIDRFTTTAVRTLEHGGDPDDPFFLLLHGPVGVGKTHLACALLKRLVLSTQCTGRFIEFQQLLFELRNCYAQNRSEETVLAPLRQADVLIIDELGKGRTENEWQMERLDDLVNSRYNGARITVFTTNFSPLGMDQDNPRDQGLKAPPTSEGFWTQSLADRLGLRIYDRIMESAQTISLNRLPSLRKLAAQKLRPEATNGT